MDDTHSPVGAPEKRPGIPPEELPLFLDTKQAALTGYASTRTIRRLCASGEIHAVKVGGYWRIPRDRFLKDISTLL